MAKRSRAEAALPSSGGSRPKRRRGQEAAQDISSEHAYSDADDDGDRQGREELRNKGLELWQAVKDHTRDQRPISELFLVQPDRISYPDYYTYIKQPIALNDIWRKLSALAYASPTDLKADFDLCFINAQTYNLEGSVIYEDAKELQRFAAELFKTNFHAKKKEKKHKSPSLRKTLKSTLQQLVNLTDDSGREIAAAFNEYPDRHQWPVYYEQIKQPQCFNNVFKRIKKKEYASVVDFADDVELIFKNCQQFNLEHTPIWEDSVTLQKTFRKLMSELPEPFVDQRYSSRPAAPKIKLKLPTTATSQAPAPQPAAPPPTLVVPPPKVAAAPTDPTQPQPVKASASTSTLKSSPSTSAGKAKAVAEPPPAAAPKPVPAKVSAPKPAAKAAESKALRSAAPATPAVVPPPPPVASKPVVNGNKPAAAPSGSHPVAPLPPTATFSQYSIPVQPPPIPAPPPPAPAPTPTVTTRSQIATTQTPAKAVHPSPAPRPVHQLDFIRVKSVPRGRPFLLDHRDGVKSWAIQLGAEETTLAISDVTFLRDDEDDSSDEEDGMDLDAEPASKPKRGRGRPSRAKAGATAKGKVKPGKKKPKLGEIQVKLNGTVKEMSRDGKGQWTVLMPVGSSTVEIGEKGGLNWKIYAHRVA